MLGCYLLLVDQIVLCNYNEWFVFDMEFRSVLYVCVSFGIDDCMVVMSCDGLVGKLFDDVMEMFVGDCIECYWFFGNIIDINGMLKWCILVCVYCMLELEVFVCVVE